MAEHLPRGRTAELFIGAGFQVAHEPALGFMKVQSREKNVGERLARHIAARLPLPGKWTQGALVDCAWLAPGEWLISGDAAQIAELAEALTELLAGSLAMVTDVTHGRISFLVRGAAAAERLASCCPLDLRGRAFSQGCCARSLFGEAKIFLARLADYHGEPAYRLLVDQSMAGYALRLLEEPARQ